MLYLVDCLKTFHWKVPVKISLDLRVEHTPNTIQSVGDSCRIKFFFQNYFKGGENKKYRRGWASDCS